MTDNPLLRMLTQANAAAKARLAKGRGGILPPLSEVVGGVAGSKNPLVHALQWAERPSNIVRTFGPQADIADMQQFGSSAVDHVRGGRLTRGLEDASWAVLAGMGLAVPGSAGQARKALEQPFKFDAAKGAENLRLHENRLTKQSAKGTPYPGGVKNPRVEITAPPDSGLPNFVVGDFTDDDWVKRTEALLSPDEVHEAAKWYEAMGDEFAQVYGDPDVANKAQGAWLAGQVNASPSEALSNMLYIREQLDRAKALRLNQTPDIKGKNFDTTNKAIKQILSDEPVTQGVGVKISDFLDSGYGADKRSFMAGGDAGGAPFVVDVHTARDMGRVDETLLNHLQKRGYNVPEGLNIDLSGGGIKGPAYENAALRGRALTEELNKRKWMGRDDWRPREVQAIGWVALDKLYGNPATGNDFMTAVNRNTRRISMEVGPGAGSPADIRFGERYSALPLQAQYDINTQITQQAIDEVRKQTGLDISNVVHGTGGWNTYLNPAAVQTSVASKDHAIASAHMLGYLLQQTEVWVNTAKEMTKNPKAFALDILEDGTDLLKDDDGIRQLWAAVQKADPNSGTKKALAVGFQPLQTIDGQRGIRVIVNQGGKRTQAGLKQLVDNFPSVSDDLSAQFKAKLSEAEVYIARNDWEKTKDGKDYFIRGGDNAGELNSPSQWSNLNIVRQELEDRTEQLIREYEAGDP